MPSKPDAKPITYQEESVGVIIKWGFAGEKTEGR